MAINEQNSVPTTAASKKVGSMLGFGAHFWEQLLLGSLAVVGVAGVAVFLFSAAVIISQRRENSAAKVEFERYKLETGETIAKANERAAEANQKAQEASLELARLKEPRSLTEEQRGRIVDKVKKFAGTEYDVTISVAEPEILGFLSIIEDVLSSAGYSEIDWKAGPEIFADRYIRGGDGGGKPLIREGVAETDVTIAVLSDQSPKLFEIAQTLSSALAAEGIVSRHAKYIRHKMSSINMNAIHIFIGRKT